MMAGSILLRLSFTALSGKPEINVLVPGAKSTSTVTIIASIPNIAAEKTFNSILIYLKFSALINQFYKNTICYSTLQFF